jgi:hypothetical protein
MDDVAHFNCDVICFVSEGPGSFLLDLNGLRSFREKTQIEKTKEYLMTPGH